MLAWLGLAFAGIGVLIVQRGASITSPKVLDAGVVA
jgi:hypothetical protein